MGTEVSGAPGGKPSEVSEAGPDGKASEAPEAAGASGLGLDGKLSEAAEAGVPLTTSVRKDETEENQ
jgi:hypothetical protein